MKRESKECINALLKRHYQDKDGHVSIRKNWLSLLDRHINKSDRVLDFGSGPTNGYTKFLSNFSNNVIGVDVDESVLGNVHLTESHTYDGKELPSSDNHFDVVTTHAVMEHVESPKIIIREFARILKPGGYLLSTQPNMINYVSALTLFMPTHLKEKLYEFLWNNDKKKEREFYPTFYRFNIPWKCKHLLMKNQFQIKEFYMLQGAPGFHGNNKMLFYIMLGYERTVNSTNYLSWFRENIQLVAQNIK